MVSIEGFNLALIQPISRHSLEGTKENCDIFSLTIWSLYSEYRSTTPPLYSYVFFLHCIILKNPLIQQSLAFQIFRFKILARKYTTGSVFPIFVSCILVCSASLRNKIQYIRRRLKTLKRKKSLNAE